MMERPVVDITAAMIDAAYKLIPEIRVHRTRVSPVDTLGGILGEFAFSQWLMGDWRKNEVGANKGKADLFGLIEIKTSIYPFKETLNLVIREDYGAKFKDVYVQNIISVADIYRKEILPGTPTIICGFASHEQATAGQPEPITMAGGSKTPYRVFKTPITKLRPMSEFPDFLKALIIKKNLRIDFSIRIRAT